MGTNHLQNDVLEPVAFASPFSSCSPEGGWVSTLYVGPLELGEELDIHSSQSSEAPLVIF